VPSLPSEAVRAVALWSKLNALQQYGVGAHLMAQAGLSAFEVDLLAVVAEEVRSAPRPRASAEEE